MQREIEFMKKMILVFVLVFLAAAFVFADTLYLENSTSWTFMAVHVSYNHSDNWGLNLLGNDILNPGGKIKIDTSRSLNNVTLDFLIIDDDLDTYTIYGKRVRNGETVKISSADLD